MFSSGFITSDSLVVVKAKLLRKSGCVCTENAVATKFTTFASVTVNSSANTRKKVSLMHRFMHIESKLLFAVTTLTAVQILQYCVVVKMHL